MAKDALLVIEHLSKSFGSTLAVDDLGFHVRPGEIYGLLGPNGAGKTTTISCACGLLEPDRGRVLIDGIDLRTQPNEFKRRIGVVPQEIAIYGDLNARENVSFWGELAGLRGAGLKRSVAEALAVVGMEEHARQPARKLSGGYKRRLNLAIGMVHRPMLLLLDEPTVGIDVEARLQILEIVRTSVRRGAAVLYTTHYLEEAQDLCHRIGVMDHGRVLAEGTLDELRLLVGKGHILTLRGAFTAEMLRAAIGDEPDLRVVGLEDGQAMLDVGTGGRGASRLLERVLGQGLRVEDISIQEPSLQAVFLKLTGREFAAGSAGK
jgi:ABC-2 type transport system ATP-binding protein